jgi:hypothetical protein
VSFRVADLDGLFVPGEAVSLNLSCEHLAQAKRVYSLLTHSPPTHCLLTYCLLTYLLLAYLLTACLLTLTYLAQAERVYYSGRNPGAYAFGKEMVRAIRGLTLTPTLPLTLILTLTLALI